MFRTLRRDAAFCALLGAALFAAATPALSQGPSEAQREAVKSQCRSDYIAHCSSVPPGGEASVQCLAKNMSSLSAGCASAVRAVQAAAAPKTEPAPAAAAAPAAGAAAAAPPTVIVLRPMRPREELFVMRSACGGDIRTLCAGVAPGGGRIMQCIANRAADLSPACRDVLAPFAAR